MAHCSGTEHTFPAPPCPSSSSTTYSTPTSHKQAKRVFIKPETLRAPLRIAIPPPQLLSVEAGLSSSISPTRDPGSEPEDFDSQSGSEASEDPVEPVTPRISLGAGSPLSPGSAFSSEYALSPSSRRLHVVDDFGLGSLRLGGRSPTSSLSSSPCSPRKTVAYRTAAFAKTVPRTSARVGPLQFLREINTGSYGTAYVARETSTGHIFCAKVCPKYSATLRDEKLKGLTSELLAYKRISAADDLARKWLMEIHGVVQDPENIVFLMDVMETDLFTFLEGPVQGAAISRWIAQIALGIDALHEMGIIHRDIKPENILIVPGTSSARVRITDFTNAWLAPGESPEEWKRNYDVEPGAPLHPSRLYAKKVIGTREYIPPEMRNSEWYGVMVDWWGLGCLMFDLLVGDVLFPDQRTMNNFVKWQRIGKKTSQYFQLRSTYLTEPEGDVMGGLLTLDPSQRFSLRHLQRHPYFTRTNVFDELHAMPTTLPRRPDPRREMPVDPAVAHLPVCCATAEPLSDDDPFASRGAGAAFDDFGWISPSSIWSKTTE